MQKIGKFDILKVSKLIEAKSIKIGSDTDLYITPREKFIVESRNAVFELKSKFLSFVEIDETKYGFGILIDKDEIQLGYGTREQFANHSLQNGLEITKTGAIIPSVETAAIPVEDVISIVDTIFA